MESEVVVFLRARIEQFQEKMGQAGRDIEKVGSKGGATFDKLASVGKAAFLGLGAGAVAFGAIAIKNADELEKSHANLVTALKNTGTTWDAQKAAIDRVQASGEKLGHTHAEVQAALAIMTTGMGSSAKAIQNIGLVEDLAAKTGKGLSEAATAVTRASEGQLRPLKQLGIDLPVAAGGALKVQKAQDALTAAEIKAMKAHAELHDKHIKTPKALADIQKADEGVKSAQEKLNTVQSTGGQILSALHDKLGGAAARQADTFGGKVKALNAQFKDMTAAIGTKLIPVIEDMVGAITDAGKWLSKHKEVLLALAFVIGVPLMAALLAYIGSMAVAAATTLIALAPIIAIVAGVTLLAAGIIYLWTHWNEVWSFIMHHKAYALIIVALFPIIGIIVAIVATIKWLMANWNAVWSTIVAITDAVWKRIGPIVMAGVNVVKSIVTLVMDVLSGRWGKIWGDILAVVSAIWRYITAVIHGAVDGLLSWWGLILAGFSAAWGGIWKGLGGAFTMIWVGVKTAIQGGVDGVKGIINGAITAINSVKIHFPGVHAGPVTLLPAFDWDGLHLPTLEMGGIVNMPKTGGLAVLHGREAVIPLDRGGNFGGGGNSYHITVNAAAASPADVGAVVVQVIKQYESRSGKAWRN